MASTCSESEGIEADESVQVDLAIKMLKALYRAEESAHHTICPSHRSRTDNFIPQRTPASCGASFCQSFILLTRRRTAKSALSRTSSKSSRM